MIKQDREPIVMEYNLYRRVELMSKDERSLLLFFEVCLVDRYGKIDVRHMNEIDTAIVKRWVEEGLIEYGRIKFCDIINSSTHWVRFSENAWKMAQYERRLRSDRCLSEVKYRKVGIDE